MGFPQLKGVTQGVTQGVTYPHIGNTPDKIKYSNDIAKTDTWLPVREGLQLLAISKKSFHANRKKGKYKCRQVHGKGGKQYEVLLSSLPIRAQEAYYKSFLPEPDPEEEKQKFDQYEADAILYANAPNYNKKQADKYLLIINQSMGLKGEELKDWIDEWNTKNPDEKTSYPRVLDARKKYLEYGIAGILGKYGNNGGETKVENSDYEYFKNLYLKQGGPSAKSCWLYTLGNAARRNPNLDKNTFPSSTSFMRRLRAEIPESAVYAARFGHAKWNRKYANYIDRDSSDIAAGELWVSDHAQVDVAVLGPDGKIYFPWLTAWTDFKSTKYLGWDLHIEPPNSDHIFISFHRAAKRYGLPADIYIDNGKDYRSKDFAGGRRKIRVEVDEKIAGSMVSMLGITSHFSLPYNAQTKNIEREFLKNKELFSKHLVGYRGGNIVERPEILAKEIKSGKVLEFARFKELLNLYLGEIADNMQSFGKNHNGLTPNQLWAEDFTTKRNVTDEALKLFCMRTSNPVTIGRNGVNDSQLGQKYWAEWMSGRKGTKVYMRRDPEAYQIAWVFDAATDEYLGQAELAASISALAKTDLERQQLRDAIASKKRDEKLVKSYLTRDESTPEELMENLFAATRLISGEPPKAKPKEFNITAALEMEKVVQKERDMRKTGTYDVPPVDEPKPKRKIYLFESDIPKK
jgi:putative transposase